MNNSQLRRGMLSPSHNVISLLSESENDEFLDFRNGDDEADVDEGDLPNGQHSTYMKAANAEKTAQKGNITLPQNKLQVNHHQGLNATVQGEIYNIPRPDEPVSGSALNPLSLDIEDDDWDMREISKPHGEHKLPSLQSEISAGVPGNLQQRIESKVDCFHTVSTLFPGICGDYISELYNAVSQSSDQLIAHILDGQENGKVWPKAKDKQNILKRKRS